MTRDPKVISASGTIAYLLFMINVIVLKNGWVTHSKWYWFLMVTIPLQLVALLVMRKQSNKYV